MDKLLTDKEHANRYSKTIKDYTKKGCGEFQNLFDHSKDVKESLIKGFWDFNLAMLTDIVCTHIKDPENKICLEIGYGGGRVLHAAAHFFKEAIGIDIHTDKAYVSKFLKSKGVDNFKLIKSKGSNIDVPDSSIDYVYSFIVLQHLATFDSFIKYMNETYRCLKTGGIAQLYLGAWNKLSKNDQETYRSVGFKEITDAEVLFTSLVITEDRAREVAKSIGFEVLATGVSDKRVPNGYLERKGGQIFITLLK